MSTHIAVVGSGYVGLVTAACFAELGHEVVCVDVDEEKINALQRGQVPIYEQWLPELLQRHGGRRLCFTSSLVSAIRDSSVVFIAVGTPSAESGEADLSYVEKVAHDVACTANGYRLIVEKSTVPVYTCELIRRTMAMSSPGADFDVVSNPEFLREGTAVMDFLLPDRIVVGADSDRAATVMQEIYKPLTSGAYYHKRNAIVSSPANGAQLILTSTKSAEIIKHASNAFLATKISFINAVASICEKVGADITEVAMGIGSDSRIGSRFLKPGIGYGGSCFPKDLKAFRSFAHDLGYEFKLLDEVMKINEDQRQSFVKKIRGAVWNLRGKRLGVLGVTFKGGTDDIRESPAIAIIEALIREDCTLSVYDPGGAGRARKVLPASVTFVDRSLPGFIRGGRPSDPYGLGGILQSRPESSIGRAGTTYSHRWTKPVRHAKDDPGRPALLQRGPAGPDARSSLPSGPGCRRRRLCSAIFRSTMLPPPEC